MFVHRAFNVETYMIYHVIEAPEKNSKLKKTIAKNRLGFERVIIYHSIRLEKLVIECHKSVMWKRSGSLQKRGTKNRPVKKHGSRYEDMRYESNHSSHWIQRHFLPLETCLLPQLPSMST